MDCPVALNCSVLHASPIFPCLSHLESESPSHPRCLLPHVAPAEAAGGATSSLPSAAAEARIEYPEGGYWGVPPAVRVTMLYSLLHDALDTYLLR